MTTTSPPIELAPRPRVPRSVWLAIVAAIAVAAAALAIAIWYHNGSTVPAPSAGALPAQVHVSGAAPGSTAIPPGGRPYNGGHEEGLAGATPPATAAASSAGARLDHRGLNYQAPSAYNGGHEEGLAGPGHQAPSAYNGGHEEGLAGPGH